MGVIGHREIWHYEINIIIKKKGMYKCPAITNQFGYNLVFIYGFNSFYEFL